MLAKIGFGENINLVKSLFNTANKGYGISFQVAPKDFQIQLLDTSHISMIMGYGNENLITELNTDKITVEPDIAEIHAVLKKIKKADSVQLGIDEIYKHYAMTMAIKHGKLSKKYSFTAAESKFIAIPHFVESVEFELPTKDFYEHIYEVSVFSDDVVIEVGEEDSVKFYPHTTGDERVSAEIEVETEIKRKAGAVAKSAFPISYFMTAKPLLSMEKTLRFGLDTDYPIVVNFGDPSVMRFMFALAPKVDYT